MGSDNNLIVKKCGDILINLKKKNKKTKTYSFRCLFCETTWDQMKKFSLHLEKFHLDNLEEESNETTVIYEPEIKIESKVESEDEGGGEEIKNQIIPVVKVDPLETMVTGDLPSCEDNCLEVQIKEENERLSDCELNIKTEEVSFDDSCDIDDNLSESDKDGSVSNIEKVEHSTDSDTKKNRCISIRKHRISKKVEDCLDINSEEKNLNITLLKLFEQKPYLWNIREKCTDEDICQKGYESIANDINSKFETSISWVFVKNRVNAMRFQCSDEIEKQQNGEDFQMPWYFEHMKYLKHNLEVLVRERVKKKRYRNIDESKLSIVIELYKKNEELWQVNNMFFGITAKRAEIYNRILDELKSDFNIKFTLSHLKDYMKYINRLFSKEKERELKCELDKSNFTSTSEHYEKLSFLNESRGPFKCLHCNKIIKNFENYRIHVAEHTNTKPFKCLLCEGDFKKFNVYLSHVKRHLSENSYRCEICGKGYSIKSELDRHMTFHTGEKQYLCQICGAGFRYSRDYDNHIRRHEKRFRFECHICKQGFNHLHILNNHVKSHLNVRDILCNICGKGFTALRYLNNHRLIHEDKKHYKCHVCGKEFAQGAGLRAHRKLHKSPTIATEAKREKGEAQNQNEKKIIV